MRDRKIQRTGNSTKRHVEFEVKDKSFQNDIDRITKILERITEERNRLR
jgi:hypothetical protein